MSIYVDELLDEIKAPKKRPGLILSGTLVLILLVGVSLYMESKLYISDVELGVLSKTAANVMTQESQHRVSSLDIWNKMVSRTGKKSTQDFTIFDRMESTKYLIGLIEANTKLIIDQVNDPYSQSELDLTHKTHNGY